MEQTQALKIARDIMNAHGLHNWNLTTSRATTVLGDCNYHKRTIRLSCYFIAEATAEHVQQVALHEVAHALTPGHRHDRVWLAKARELGYTGGRCDTSGIDMLKHKYPEVDILTVDRYNIVLRRGMAVNTASGVGRIVKLQAHRIGVLINGAERIMDPHHVALLVNTGDRKPSPKTRPVIAAKPSKVNSLDERKARIAELERKYTASRPQARFA